MIETMSLSLSLISLTIAVLCMMNVKYVSYFYVKLFRLNPSNSPAVRPAIPKSNFLVIPRHRLPWICQCFLSFRRLHLPRNLLHMHLFVAFIFRSIVKLVFIHLIIGGYTRPMINYTQDKCGNIEILTKSSNLFHVESPHDFLFPIIFRICYVFSRSLVVEYSRHYFGILMLFLKHLSSAKQCFYLRH